MCPTRKCEDTARRTSRRHVNQGSCRVHDKLAGCSSRRSAAVMSVATTNLQPQENNLLTTSGWRFPGNVWIRWLLVASRNRNSARKSCSSKPVGRHVFLLLLSHLACKLCVLLLPRGTTWRQLCLLRARWRARQKKPLGRLGFSTAALPKLSSQSLFHKSGIRPGRRRIHWAEQCAELALQWLYRPRRPSLPSTLLVPMPSCNFTSWK